MDTCSISSSWREANLTHGSGVGSGAQNIDFDWNALQVALTRLDHSPQNFKASVGRSGAISNRRPPSRSSRASSRTSRRSSAESLTQRELGLDEDVAVPKIVNVEIQFEDSASACDSQEKSKDFDAFNYKNYSSFSIGNTNLSDTFDLKQKKTSSFHSLFDNSAKKYSNAFSSSPLLHKDSKLSRTDSSFGESYYQSTYLEDSESHHSLSEADSEVSLRFPVYSQEKYDNVESSSETEVVISDRESIADSGIVNRRTIIRISEKSKSSSSLEKQGDEVPLVRDLPGRHSLRNINDSSEIGLVPIDFGEELSSGINVSIRNSQESLQNQRRESISRMFVRQSDSENRPTRASAFNVRRTIEKRQIQQERRERKALRDKIRAELRSLSESRQRDSSSCSSISSTYLSKSLSSLDQDQDDYRCESPLIKVQSNPTLESEKDHIRTYLFGSNLINDSHDESSSFNCIISPVPTSLTKLKLDREENLRYTKSACLQDIKNIVQPEPLKSTDLVSPFLSSNRSVNPTGVHSSSSDSSPIPPPRRRSRTSKSTGQLTVEKENKPEWLRQAKERRSLRIPKVTVEQLSERAPSVVSTQEPEWVSKARKKLESMNVCLTSITDTISIGGSQVTESSSAWSRGGLDALEDLKEEVSRISEELTDEASGRVDKDLNLLDKDKSSRMIEYKTSHGSREPSSERQRVSFDATADQGDKSRKSLLSQLPLQSKDEVRFGDLKHDWGGVQKVRPPGGKHKETRFGEVHIQENSVLESKHQSSINNQRIGNNSKDERLSDSTKSIYNSNRPVMLFGDSPHDLFTEMPNHIKSQSSSKFESISGPDPLTMTADQLNQNVEEYDFPIPKGNEDAETLLTILKENLEKSEVIPEVVCNDSDKPKPKSILKRKSMENIQLETKEEMKANISLKSDKNNPENKKLESLESYKLLQKAENDNNIEPKHHYSERSVEVNDTRPSRKFMFSFNPYQMNYMGSNKTSLEQKGEETFIEPGQQNLDSVEAVDSISLVVHTHPDDVRRSKLSMDEDVLSRPVGLIGSRKDIFGRRSLREPLSRSNESHFVLQRDFIPTNSLDTKKESTLNSNNYINDIPTFDKKVPDIKIPINTSSELTAPAAISEACKKTFNNKKMNISNHSSTEKKKQFHHPKSPEFKKRDSYLKSPDIGKREIFHHKPKEVLLEIVDNHKRKAASLDTKRQGTLFEWEAIQRQRIEDEERNRINKGLSMKPVSNKIKELVKLHSGFMSMFGKDRRGDGTVDGKDDIFFQRIPSPGPQDEYIEPKRKNSFKSSMKSPYIVQKMLNPRKNNKDKIALNGKQQSEKKSQCSNRSKTSNYEKVSKVEKIFPKELKSFSNSILQSDLKDANFKETKTQHKNEEKYPRNIKDPQHRREWVEKMLNTLSTEEVSKIDQLKKEQDIINNRLSMYRRSFHEFLPRKDVETTKLKVKTFADEDINSNFNLNDSENIEASLNNDSSNVHHISPLSDDYKPKTETHKPRIFFGEKENISPSSQKKVKNTYNSNFYLKSNLAEEDFHPKLNDFQEKKYSSPFSVQTGIYREGSPETDSVDDRSCYSPVSPSDINSVFESSREGSPFRSDSFTSKVHRERSLSLRSASSIRSTPDRDGPVSLSSILERDSSSPSSSMQRLSVSEELKEITEKYRKDRSDRRLSMDSSIAGSDVFHSPTLKPHPNSTSRTQPQSTSTTQLKYPSKRHSVTKSKAHSTPKNQPERFHFGMLSSSHPSSSSKIQKDRSLRRSKSPSPTAPERRKKSPNRRNKHSVERKSNKKYLHEIKDTHKQEKSIAKHSSTTLQKDKDMSRSKLDKNSSKQKILSGKQVDATKKATKEYKHPRIEVKLVRRKSSLKKHHPPVRAKKDSVERKMPNGSLKKEKKSKEKDSGSENYESIRYRDGVGWTKTSVRRTRLSSDSSDKRLSRKDSTASRSERSFKTEASKALEKWAAGATVPGKLVKKEGQKYSHHVEEEEKEGKKYSKAISRKVVRRGSRRLSQGGEILSETKEMATGDPSKSAVASQTNQKALVLATPPENGTNGVSRKMKTSTDGERYVTSSVHTLKGIKKHTTEGVDSKTTKSKEIIGGDGWEGEREMSGRLGERVVVERSVGGGLRPSTVVKKSTSQAKVIVTKTKRKSPSTAV